MLDLGLGGVTASGREGVSSRTCTWERIRSGVNAEGLADVYLDTKKAAQ